MRKLWAKVDQATGKIVMEGSGLDPENVLQSQLAEAGYDVFEDRPAGVTGGEYYRDYVAGTWEARPTVPAWSNPYDLTALPSGSVVIVENEAGDILTVTELTEDLTLTDPGVYFVHVKPPFPHKEIRQRVEVS